MSKIGVLMAVDYNTDILEKLETIKSYGFECCQLSTWDTSLYCDEKAAELRAASEKTGIEISTIWAGWSGPKEWNFTGGPTTLGLVPPAFRMIRAEELIRAAHFASAAGVTRVATHVGFLPENMTDSEYSGMLSILRYILKEYKKLDINFLFETGQETP